MIFQYILEPVIIQRMSICFEDMLKLYFFCRYKTQVDRFADMWRDERFTPIEEATYWIELLHKVTHKLCRWEKMYGMGMQKWVSTAPLNLKLGRPGLHLFIQIEKAS